MLDPIFAIVGGAALIAWLKKRGEQPTLPPPSTSVPVQQTGTRGNPVAPGLPKAPDIGALPIPDGVKDALAKAGQLILTTTVAGGAALVASEGAGQLDKIFAPGMDGRPDPSNRIARVAGAPVFVATFLSGLALFKFIPVAVLLTGLAYSGVGFLLIAVVWFVAIVIENLNALSFGQKGALEEMRVCHFAVRDRLVSEFTNPNVEQLKDDDGYPVRRPTAVEAHRVAEQAAVGFCSELNRIRYDTWMKDKAWGIGATRAAHAKFGHQRGYFVGWIDDATGNLNVDFNVMNDVPTPGQAFNPSWIATHVPEAERTTRTGQQRSIKIITIVPQQDPMLVKLGIKPIPVTKVEWAVSSVSYQCDKHIDDWMKLGREMANTMAFSRWMGPENRTFYGNPRDPKTVVQPSDYQHAKYGIEHGRFHGSIDSQGRLLQNVMSGNPKVIHWRDGVVKP